MGVTKPSRTVSSSASLLTWSRRFCSACQSIFVFFGFIVIEHLVFEFFLNGFGIGVNRSFVPKDFEHGLVDFSKGGVGLEILLGKRFPGSQLSGRDGINDGG